MCTASDVANFFISVVRHSEEETMSNMRLNKLLYFSQGWCLARLGRPLFNDPIEAWKYGPVVPSIYRKYERYGRNNIDAVDADYDRAKCFTDDEFTLLLDVFDRYRDYTAAGLVRRSHKDGAPWADVFDPAQKVLMPLDSIKAWFDNQEPLPAFELPPPKHIFTKRDPITGYVVLPKEWADDWE